MLRLAIPLTTQTYAVSSTRHVKTLTFEKVKSTLNFLKLSPHMCLGAAVICRPLGTGRAAVCLSLLLPSINTGKRYAITTALAL
eukprot:scaffold419187_cov19-Prasinocladus_malaysianus.AAC.1